MFNRIAFRYDFLNRFLSFGVDTLWRRRVVAMTGKIGTGKILDVATGTGDLALMLSRANPAAAVTGIDLSPQMLDIARSKIARRKAAIDVCEGDAENLPFTEGMFDAVTVGFGVRNFENIDQGLREMHRVLRAGGTILILEFSMPENKLFGALYTFYFRRLLPFIGGVVSGEAGAYRYLQESVEAFEYGNRFAEKMSSCGFSEITQTRLTQGLAIIYKGVKK